MPVSTKLKSLIPPFSLKTVIACLLWYTVSSVTSQLTKLILTKFTYPLFLSQCQFLLGATLAFCLITLASRYPSLEECFPKGSLPAQSRQMEPILSLAMLLKILPLGLFQFIGKYLSLSATSLIPLATNSSIKALSPMLIVLGYRIFYKVVFPFITYASLVPLLAGVVLIISSDSGTTGLFINDNNELDSRHIKGLTFCLLSTVVFAAQNIYGKQLITWDSDYKIHNPASLVLNTDPSRPSTPMPFSLHVEKSTTPVDYFDSNIGAKNNHNDNNYNNNNNNYNNNNNNNNNNKNKNKNFLYVRQRTNSLHLPYSTSDLTLDEMKESHLLGSPPSAQNSNKNPSHSSPFPSYENMALQNNTNVNNPFAYFINKFELHKLAKPDKITIILYCSLIGSSFSIGGFVMNELPKMYRQFNDTEFGMEDTIDTASEFLTIMVLIFLVSISHFLQTLLAFHLLGSIPALSYSIASMLKRIVLITISLIVTIGYSTTTKATTAISATNSDDGDPVAVIAPVPGKTHVNMLTRQQVAGLALIAMGLYCYDRWGSRSLKSR